VVHHVSALDPQKEALFAKPELRERWKAIKVGGKLLVMDQVVEPRNQPGLAKIMDLEMLVNPGGLERTEKQWNDLFAASGFRLERIIRTTVPQCIIEGVPV
jgi:hypothetical protein